ncbi:13612_t:CDS:2 [Cetraspora pellucida]|uniref:13612_t:CDS:1 n=1 Tax=Cetraspora pellucida TaxID=1433469 RepID=A0A9N9IC80_9GLOM|nr:13612_t:CDS:2 [Cetraspora pellucida]
MASFVNKHCKDSQWNAKIANGCWCTYKKIYMETRMLANKSGWGLTEDHKKGIITIEAKLDELCSYFSRIDTIYREKQNVQPSFLENFRLNNEDNIKSNDIQEQNDELQSDKYYIFKNSILNYLK